MSFSNGGGGGAGGYGAVSDLGASAALGTALTGGTGGAGGSANRYTGEGGSGGIGLYVHGSSAAVVLTAQAGIQGGTGGDSGADIDIRPGQKQASQAGAGGAGLFAANPLSIVVESRIAGGDGGQDMSGASGPLLNGAGGAGIVGTDLNVTVSATGEVSGGFTGGHAGDEAFRTNAITFTGGNNRLEVQAGGEINGNIAIETGALEVDTSSATTLTNAITGGGMLMKYGAGTLRLEGASTYAGRTLINEGMIELTRADGLGKLLGLGLGSVDFTGSLAGLQLRATVSGTLDNQITISPSSGGTISVATDHTLTLTGYTAFFEQVTFGTATDTGTIVLNGNSYSRFGTVVVAGGTLLVNSEFEPHSITVEGGATLGGDGQLQLVTVEAGGILAPGNSPGVIDTHDLLLNPGAILKQEIGGTAMGSFDQTKVTGTVSLDGANLQLAQWGGFVSSTGESFIIIDNNGSTDAVTGTFAGLAQGATLSFAGRTLKIDYAGGDGNDVVLTDVTPAPPRPPEPPAITAAQIKAAHLGVLGLSLSDAAAALVVSDILKGSYSFDGYITTLIEQADTSTLPAVIVNALLAGVTPTQSHLPELGAFSTSQFAAYRDAGSTNPKLGPYEALGLGFSATATFQSEYGTLTDAQFLATAYQDVFGRAASTAQIAHFEAQLGYFEGLYAGAGQSETLADLHAKGAVIGQMLGHAVLDEPQLHSFDDAAIAFLRAAAIGQAQYGEPLAMI